MVNVSTVQWGVWTTHGEVLILRLCDGLSVTLLRQRINPSLDNTELKKKRKKGERGNKKQTKNVVKAFTVWTILKRKERKKRGGGGGGGRDGGGVSVQYLIIKNKQTNKNKETKNKKRESLHRSMGCLDNTDYKNK